MRVRITSPSVGKTSFRPITMTNSRGQATNLKQKTAKTGESAAFLVQVMDASDVDPSMVSFDRVCPETGETVAREAFTGAYEMWFPLNRTASGEPCLPDSGKSFVDAIIAKMSQCHTNGAFLTFEFEPVFGATYRQAPSYGAGDNASHLYQTLTIGFNNYGLKRFGEARPTAVEGL